MIDPMHPLVIRRRAFKATTIGGLVMAKTPYGAMLASLVIASILIYRALPVAGTGTSIVYLLVGMFLWKLTEYFVHRIIFHGYRRLPVSSLMKEAFEGFHVPHHYEDIDGINAGPLFYLPLSMLIFASFWGIEYLLAGSAWRSMLLLSGLYLGFMMYEWLHYQMHLGTARGAYLDYLRRFHHLHHYRDWRKNFGITSPLIDMLFMTYAVPAPAVVLEESPAIFSQKANGARSSGV